MVATSGGTPGSGYSGTPLPRKLGLKPGQRVVALDAPEVLAELLPDVEWQPALDGGADVVLAFVTRRGALSTDLAKAGPAVFPDGMIWVCWPKKASKVPTDVTEDVVRELALPRGLVDVKVCAVDATWSGLKLMWRKERRSGPLPG